jgi:hypothetical protein
MIARDRLPKLLNSPFRGWMRGDVAVQDAPCPEFHEKKDVQGSEPSGHDNQEVAGHDRLRVIADKRPPMLRRDSARSSRVEFRGPVGTHNARGNIDSELDGQLGCYAGLSPGRKLERLLATFSHYRNFILDVQVVDRSQSFNLAPGLVTWLSHRPTR